MKRFPFPMFAKQRVAVLAWAFFFAALMVDSQGHEAPEIIVNLCGEIGKGGPNIFWGLMGFALLGFAWAPLPVAILRAGEAQSHPMPWRLLLGALLGSLYILRGARGSTAEGGLVLLLISESLAFISILMTSGESTPQRFQFGYRAMMVGSVALSVALYANIKLHEPQESLAVTIFRALASLVIVALYFDMWEDASRPDDPPRGAPPDEKVDRMEKE